MESRASAREAAADVAANPADDLARAAFQLQLRKLLADDPALERELQQVIASSPGGHTASHGGVVIGGNVTADRGGIASGRDVNLGDR